MTEKIDRVGLKLTEFIADEINAGLSVEDAVASLMSLVMATIQTLATKEQQPGLFGLVRGYAGAIEDKMRERPQ